jgi:hypothetical protein
MLQQQQQQQQQQWGQSQQQLGRSRFCVAYSTWRCCTALVHLTLSLQGRSHHESTANAAAAEPKQQQQQQQRLASCLCCCRMVGVRSAGRCLAVWLRWLRT